ncbi:hypothetical protein JCM5296_004404 [Sporobolomyces johnsonii]
MPSDSLKNLSTNSKGEECALDEDNEGDKGDNEDHGSPSHLSPIMLDSQGAFHYLSPFLSDQIWSYDEVITCFKSLDKDGFLFPKKGFHEPGQMKYAYRPGGFPPVGPAISASLPALFHQYTHDYPKEFFAGAHKLSHTSLRV